MIHADARFSDEIEKAVGALETQTDAEVVVVAAERSGQYRDIAFAVGSAAAALTFLGLLAIPVSVHPVTVLLDMTVMWALVSWLANGQRVIRRLASSARQDEQVHTAAAAEFHREAVHATPRRMGLLIYVSALEGRVELVPDMGLEGAIPRGMWAKATAEFAHDDLDHFLAGLSRVGAVLAERVPVTEGERVDLPNAPRIR